MNEYSTIFKKIEQQYGKEIFSNGNKLVNIFGTITTNPEMNQIFKYFIYVRGNKKIIEDKNNLNQVVALMQQKYNCSELNSRQVCEAFLQKYYDLKTAESQNKGEPRKPKQQYEKKIMDYDMNDVLNGIKC